jgi:phosphatidylserine/phosphatidylglycerophosphate/cardiolipin synthase-like enzyme
VTAEPLPALRALSARALSDLARGLKSDHIAADASSFLIRHIAPGVSETAAIELCSLLATGLAPEHAALLVGAIAAERLSPARSVLELVTSGPDAVGGTRDTGVALRELFASAERRVLVVGFAVHQGREIFAVLAQRMRQLPDLMIRLCLDVRRAPGDMTRRDALLRRFAERFMRQEWPGPRMPELFYDPRSLAGYGPRASLHAKCVVVDGVKAFIGSANLTEAAQLRNIEIGLMLTDNLIANAVERHVEALIMAGHLKALPLDH